MIITIKRDAQATVTIDTATCVYPCQFKNAIELALELDGHTKESIDEMFGRYPNTKCAEPISTSTGCSQNGTQFYDLNTRIS